MGDFVSSFVSTSEVVFFFCPRAFARALKWPCVRRFFQQSAFPLPCKTPRYAVDPLFFPGFLQSLSICVFFLFCVDVGFFFPTCWRFVELPPTRSVGCACLARKLLRAVNRTAKSCRTNATIAPSCPPLVSCFLSSEAFRRWTSRHGYE